MDLFELINHISTNEDAIQFLRERGILRSLQNPPQCTLVGCQREMTQVKRRSLLGDGVGWRCPSHKGRKISIRRGSFLDKSNLEPKKFILFTYLWAVGAPSHLQEKLCGFAIDTVVNWNNYIREVCSQHLIMHPIQLGGVGRVVQIDESLLSKRKAHVGHLVPERWVFGMFDTEARIGVLRFVEDRRQATLFALIRQYILPGSTIYSDRAAMYMNNQTGVDPPPSHIINIPVNPPYVHASVNHKTNFVDPTTGACTNMVEGFWKNAKSKNKEMNGTTVEMLPSYMDEFQWRQMFGKKTSEAFDNILQQISVQYPVNN